MNDQLLKTWEPNAPGYDERKASLQYAFEQGYRTSVSVEPMLDAANIASLITDLRPFVKTDIWLGTMNHTDDIKKWAGDGMEAEIARVAAGQSSENLTAIYNTYKDDKLIKWKTEALKTINSAQKKEEKKSA
jgi:hypothetical protein